MQGLVKVKLKKNTKSPLRRPLSEPQFLGKRVALVDFHAAKDTGNPAGKNKFTSEFPHWLLYDWHNLFHILQNLV